MFFDRGQPGIYSGYIGLSRVHAESLQWCTESFLPNTMLHCQLCWRYTRQFVTKNGRKRLWSSDTS